MSMSVHIRGLKKPDDRHSKMITAYNACRDAGVTPPDEVLNYFGGNGPDERGTEVEVPYSSEEDDASNTYTVDLELVPEYVTHIQFVLGW